MTRQEWLTQLVDKLRPLFRDAGYPLPPEIETSPGSSCPGYPSYGIIFFPSGKCHIYIKPRLSDSFVAASALLWQLRGSALGVNTKNHVNELGKNLGYHGNNLSPVLKFLLKNIIADIGEYPRS